jgi:hypothetical protein
MEKYQEKVRKIVCCRNFGVVVCDSRIVGWLFMIYGIIGWLMVIPGIVERLMRLYDLAFNGCEWSLRLILFYSYLWLEYLYT